MSNFTFNGPVDKVANKMTVNESTKESDAERGSENQTTSNDSAKTASHLKEILLVLIAVSGAVVSYFTYKNTVEQQEKCDLSIGSVIALEQHKIIPFDNQMSHSPSFRLDKKTNNMWSITVKTPIEGDEAIEEKTVSLEPGKTEFINLNAHTYSLRLISADKDEKLLCVESMKRKA